MKRIFSLIAALVMCVAVMCPIPASADTFVPSISYKDGPTFAEAELKDETESMREDVSPCLIITSVLAAENKTTDIHQSERDLLLDVYQKLSEGSMKLPLPDNYVVRELVDIDFGERVCIEPDHIHMEELEKEGVTVTARFYLGVTADTDVVVLSYHDGEWEPIKSVVNNGDGTLTCEFEHFCPVAFCVRESVSGDPVQTGDSMGNTLYIWVVVMVAALIGLVTLLVVSMRRKKR